MSHAHCRKDLQPPPSFSSSGEYSTSGESSTFDHGSTSAQIRVLPRR
ncbi:hypothetical protein IC582_002134 [Cucumis melo]